FSLPVPLPLSLPTLSLHDALPILIPSLQPSAYNLTVEAKGFSTSKETGITLLADQTLTVNVNVKLGMTTEVVTVMGNALQVDMRSEEHTLNSSHVAISYAVFCLKK